MSNGTSGLYLWKLVIKINADDAGFTWTSWIANKVQADAQAAGVDIARRIINLLPVDSEIFSARLYRWDDIRNAMALRNAGGDAIPVVGAGLYGTLLSTPAPDKCDNVHSAFILRFEDSDLAVVPRKFNLIPDSVTFANDLVAPVTDVVGIPAALPALPASPTTYAAMMTAFMGALLFQTHHVQKGAVPGGAYKWKPWQNCYLNRVAVKKGGRVITA
ncbi:MAG TPA: hypothetical protein VKT72_07360 [Candidatus Baltobacteraceae bacterium]|nr:hypothetical protein [Candidatus Baltobacteraceae bacterium]